MRAYISAAGPRLSALATLRRSAAVRRQSHPAWPMREDRVHPSTTRMSSICVVTQGKGHSCCDHLLATQVSRD